MIWGWKTSNRQPGAGVDRPDGVARPGDHRLLRTDRLAVLGFPGMYRLPTWKSGSTIATLSGPPNRSDVPDPQADRRAARGGDLAELVTRVAVRLWESC